MRAVDEAIEEAMVHRAVRPVEVRVLEDDERRDAQREPAPAALGDLLIAPDDPEARGPPGEDPHEGEDHDRARRPADVVADPRRAAVSGVDPAMREAVG